MKIQTTLLMAIACIVSMSALASSAIKANVTSVGIYGNGRVFVHVDELIDESACPKRRFDVDGDRAEAQRVHELASMAFSKNLPITVKTGGCFGLFPTLSSSVSSYFIVHQDRRAPAPLLISRNNEVAQLAVNSNSGATSHFVTWANALDEACVFGSTLHRTRLSAKDEALYSLLLTARSTGQEVGFYYSISTDLPGVAGHGSGCQISNAWLEAD